MTDLQSLYQEHKNLLFHIAYRMLGSVMDAEDIVQDVFLRLETTAIENVSNQKAYLSKMVTNLCIDHLRSARSKRETYIGPWLPEPLLTEMQQGPEEAALYSEHLSFAFLVLLETLAPVERAVFVLREVFAFEYHEIADVVGKQEANCRQICTRARKKLALEQQTVEQTDANSLPLLQSMIEKYLLAMHTGDMEGLKQLLTTDIRCITDGGGKAQAALHPVVGQERVVAFMMGVAKKLGANLRIRATLVNGEPGLINYVGDQVHSVLLFQMENGQISTIYSVVNPDKLQRIV